MYRVTKPLPRPGPCRVACLAFHLGILLGLEPGNARTPVDASEPDSVTLEEAIARTWERNPDLAAHRLEIQAREARRSQAGRGLNPELNLEAENFAGTGSLSGVDGVETTVGVAQVLELGGKRAARKNLAASEKELAEWDLRSSQSRLLTEVRGAFVEVLAAQERLRILREGLDVNQQILATAKLRHQAGKAPATEEMKARMAYSLGHMDIDRAVQELESAKIRLAALWSREPPAFKGAKGDLHRILPPPSLDSLLPLLAYHPEVARWKTEAAQRQFALQSARAERIPDLSVGGGVRRIQDGGTGEMALVAGLSMPLPLFNRNRGSVQEAEHRLAKSEKERQSVEADLSARLRTLHRHLSARGEELDHLQDELLPESEKTLQASREGYRLGKLSFLEILDSQRMVNELRSRYISTLAEYHRDWNELQSLTSSGGLPIP